MQLQKTAETLKREGFIVTLFETGRQAAEHIASELSGKTVGIGGSVSVEQIGLYDLLSKNNTVFWHWKQQGADVRARAAAAQVYIASANAIAETGEIINIDGSGNRVSAMLYGHEKVIIVAGINKIVDDYESAVYRARNIAAPLNARRLGKRTPCALSAEMKCYDCDSPERICRGLVVLLRPLGGNAETEIVLVNEPLGF